MSAAVQNFQDGDEVDYPLVLLEGSIEVKTTDRVEILVGGQENGTIDYSQGRFKAVLMLKSGENLITIGLERGDLLTSLVLKYRVIVNPSRIVRMVYLLSKDGDGSIQSPEDEGDDVSMESALERVKLAGRLIQCATAELLYRQFKTEEIPRRSFAIADEVYVHRLRKTTAELYDLDRDGGYSLWRNALEELGDTTPEGFDRNSVIDVAIMSFSRFDEDAGRVRGHTALGGGQLGLFGSASCFAWPERVHTVQACFLDDRSFDPRKILDDGFRTRRWALAATTVGAVLHELGHCLDLPHVRHVAAARGGGIMNRGFDHFNRLFVTTERLTPLSVGQEPFWDRPGALRLFWHKYIGGLLNVPSPKTEGLRVLGVRPEAGSTDHNDSDHSSVISTSYEADQAPVIVGTDQIVVFSPKGLRQVTYLLNGDTANHDEFATPMPLCVVLDRKTIWHRVAFRDSCNDETARSNDEIKLCATDTTGRDTSYVMPST